MNRAYERRPPPGPGPLSGTTGPVPAAHHLCRRGPRGRPTTTLVGLLTAEPLPCPVRFAVTRTVIFLPFRAVLSVSDVFVAPEILLPPAYHW